MSQGLFITIEGGEGVGKSTNIEAIEQWLQQRDIAYCRTREPGGTELAEKIRSLLLDTEGEDVADLTELLLMFAARSQHIQQRILPALERGEWVICDRFTDATYAYQGAGRELSSSPISILEDLVQGSLRPDVTLLLDAPVEVGMARAQLRGELDRFEREQLAFFERVRRCYLDRAAAEPERFHLIDCDQPLAAVRSDLLQRLEQIARRAQR